MARTIKQIQDDLILKVQADPILGGQLTSTSKTAIWRLWTYIVAVCIWALENLHDTFKSDVNNQISLLKPHTLQWYALKAKAFQFGYNLVPDTDYYDNTGIDPLTVLASQIVVYAAVVEQIRGLRIKVAKYNGVDLIPLSNQELAAFVNYMEKVKDAGVKLNITSSVADSLKTIIRVKYNPLVLNNVGGRLDGVTSTPLQDGLRLHLKNLPFNGVFSVLKMVDALQVIEGVSDLAIDGIQTKYGGLPFTTVNIDYIPDSGYLRIDDANLTITWIPA